MSKEIHIYHAGSVASLIKETAASYRQLSPATALYLNSMGSVDCIRHVRQGEPADLVVLADFSLIEEYLFPQWADWYVIFAANRMVLVTSQNKKIPDQHWAELLTSAAVRFGHTDPEKDPCGYRTLMAWQLEESYRPGLYRSLLSHPGRIVYPGPSPMLEDLKQGKLDFCFEYASVAEEHHLPMVELANRCNLSDPELEELYRSVSVPLGDGKQVRGSTIAYALTVPRPSRHPQEALEFCKLLLETDLSHLGLKPVFKPVGVVPGFLAKGSVI